MSPEEIIPSQAPTTGVAQRLSRARGWFRDRLFRQLFKNVGVLVSGDAVSSLFGLGYLALTTRALGARQFGVLVLVQTFAALVDRLVNFQSWQGLIKYGAEALEQKRHDDFKGMIKLGTALDAAGAALGAIVGISVGYGCGHWFGWDQETRHMAVAYSSVILCSLSGTPLGMDGGRRYQTSLPVVHGSSTIVSEGNARLVARPRRELAILSWLQLLEQFDVDAGHSGQTVGCLHCLERGLL
jgi:hypothetical protein